MLFRSADEQGRKFTIKVLDFMRDVLIDFQKETGNNYNLEATPAEGTSYSLAKIDKERYPDIITAGQKDEGQFFYTNSTQLPVNFTDDVFERPPGIRMCAIGASEGAFHEWDATLLPRSRPRQLKSGYLYPTPT